MVLTRLLGAQVQCTFLYPLPQLWMRNSSSLMLISDILVIHMGRCSTNEFDGSSLNCCLAWTNCLERCMDHLPLVHTEGALIAKGIGKD